MNSKTTWRGRLHKHSQDLSLFLLRLWLGQEFLYAASQKWLLGLQPPDWFAQLDFPWPLTWLTPSLNWLAAGVGELVFGLALVAGVFTRTSAMALLFITWVAVYTVHFDLGWAGWRQIETEQGNGFKVPLMIGLMLLVLVAQGAGRWSITAVLHRHRNRW